MLRRIIAVVCACALAAEFPLASFAQQSAFPQSAPAIHATSELVLVNVVARDKKGNLVRDLKQQDFTVLEDGQKQQVASFDFENIDELALAQQTMATATGTSGPAPASVAAEPQERAADARYRRLILLFFDFSAMDPELIDRAVDAAKKYVNTKMQSADLIAIVSLSTNMRLDLDFTDDKTKILSTLSAYNSGSGQGFDNGATGSAEGSAETGGSFTANKVQWIRYVHGIRSGCPAA